jgi:hypothetical protein
MSFLVLENIFLIVTGRKDGKDVSIVKKKEFGAVVCGTAA